MTKEGFTFPLPFLAIAAVFMFLFSKYGGINLAYIAVVFFFLAMCVMLFFRDPERKIPEGDGLIISPADGRIIKIDEKNGNPTVSIFMSVFNVHVNRAPVDGKIKSINFHPGKFYSAFKDKAMRENQRNEIELESSSGIIKMTQVTGAIARRTICYPKPGDVLKAGQRIGLIRFGSRVDLVLPAGSKIDVKLKQKVTGGKTVLGKLP